jgi:uncharacterized membrane protein
MQTRLPYLTIVFLVFLWCLGIYAAPLVSDSAAGTLLYALYHSVCHQISDHSFHIHAAPLAVCIRCTSLYTGFFLGILYMPFSLRPLGSLVAGRYYIVILAVPMILDVSAAWLTGYSSTVWTRTASGGLFGFGAALLLVPLFLEAFEQMTGRESMYPLHK